MAFKKNLISIGIGLIASVPLVIAAQHSQGRVDVYYEPIEVETETYTEQIQLYHPDSEEVAPVQPIYDFIPLSDELQVYTCDLADAYGINPMVVFALMWRESRFDETAINSTGVEYSVGLMQINTYWHQTRMDLLGVTDLSDSKQNILVGITYLSELFNWREGTSLEWVLMAYNGGPSYADVMTAQGKVSPYAQQVMDKLREMEALNGQL